jgi:hypothetical protein
VELNPVRAGIAADPGDYRWSSYGSKNGNKKEARLDFDPRFVEEIEQKIERRVAFRGQGRPRKSNK